MRTLYLDSEFTRLSLDRRLISLALVEADGVEFYVELDDGWSLADCSPFVVEIVLPQLDARLYGLSREAARLALQRFLLELGELEIVSDALAWDWPLLLELLGRDGLPQNVRGCREQSDLLRDLDEQSIPHHALLDARLMARASLTRAP